MENKKDQPERPEGTSNKKTRAQMQEALLFKRGLVIAELHKIDQAIAQLQADFSRKMETYQSKRKPSEQALHHIDALLKLEGLAPNDIQSKIGVINVSYKNEATKITDSAYELLSRVHKSMHYKEIFDKLQEKGLFIPGKNPAATLLSRMSRDKRFKRGAKRGTYGLSTWRMRTSKAKRKRQGKKKT